MSDKYVIYYLQTRACVVEWPGQCHFLLCRWQSLKQSVWTDDRVTGVDRDISTSVPLELFAKTLETGNILQQVTTNYLKWSHAILFDRLTCTMTCQVKQMIGIVSWAKVPWQKLQTKVVSTSCFEMSWWGSLEAKYFFLCAAFYFFRLLLLSTFSSGMFQRQGSREVTWHHFDGLLFFMSCFVCLFQKSCSALFCVVMSLMLDIKMLDKVLWGCFGGVGAGAMITFLTVRTWWFMYKKCHTCCYAVHSSWYTSWYVCCYAPSGSCTWSDIHVLRCALLVVHELMRLLLRSSCFMYIKWHTCCYALHCLWYISWYFCCYAPQGSCSDIRVATLRALRDTWVDKCAATLLMIHVHEGTYVLLRCSFFVVQESHAATLLMVHVHEVTYVLLRCAPCGGASRFMYMKWHSCWYAVRSLWYMSWYFCCYAPHGLCTWSDIRVATLFILHGTRVSCC